MPLAPVDDLSDEGCSQPESLSANLQKPKKDSKVALPKKAGKKPQPAKTEVAKKALKRPAASMVKKPSANKDGVAKETKAYKYWYKNGEKYGIKFGNSEMCTVIGPQCEVCGFGQVVYRSMNLSRILQGEEAAWHKPGATAGDCCRLAKL